MEEDGDPKPVDLTPSLPEEQQNQSHRTVIPKATDLQRVVNLGKQMLEEVDKNWKPEILDAAIRKLDWEEEAKRRVFVRYALSQPKR